MLCSEQTCNLERTEPRPGNMQRGVQLSNRWLFVCQFIGRKKFHLHVFTCLSSTFTAISSKLPKAPPDARLLRHISTHSAYEQPGG